MWTDGEDGIVLIVMLLAVLSLTGVGWWALVVAASRDGYRSRNGGEWPFGGFTDLSGWALVIMTMSIMAPGVAAFRIILAPGDGIWAVASASLLVGSVFAVLSLFYRWMTRFSVPPEGR